MVPPDYAELKAELERIDRTIEQNERFLREARAKTERIRASLASSAPEVAAARRALRRAGYLDRD